MTITVLAIVGSTMVTGYAFFYGSRLLNANEAGFQPGPNDIAGLIVFVSPLLLLYFIVKFFPAEYFHLRNTLARNWTNIFAFGLFFLFDSMRLHQQESGINIYVDTDGFAGFFELLLTAGSLISISTSGIIALIYHTFGQKASLRAIFLQSMATGLAGVYGTLAALKYFLHIN